MSDESGDMKKNKSNARSFHMTLNGFINFQRSSNLRENNGHCLSNYTILLRISG